MNNRELIISGNHVELTPKIRELVNQKVDKLFNHSERILRIRVELGHERLVSHKDEYWAKGHIEIDRKPMIVTEKHDDLAKAVDIMSHKLDRQLRRRSRLRIAKRKKTHELDIPANIPKIQPT